ncbi:DNA polymerase III psi subunit [Klebsiella pneumoniae]|uniref:DNA polymerase III psi subunit n=1 Tax=Klebsiella pneumoniae TaxID=573 RepID=A0A377UU94_KLEPN|nr:DNA polymerase III psi subunit [Klebsiella pneumoniae]
MTSRRDWQLQQLGITQWSLRRPGALQGEIAISLPEHIRLVMVGGNPAVADRAADWRHITRAGRDARSGPAADSGAGGDAAAGQPLQQLAVGHRGVAAAGGRPGVHPRF